MIDIYWTEQSIEDLNNISVFIAKDSIKYSVIQIQRIRERVILLKTQPKLGRIVPEYDNIHIRELLMGNYRIIYRIVSTLRIDIITIHHSSRLL